MRYISILLVCLTLLVSCKSNKENQSTSENPDELTVAQKIANAHGIDNWDRVSEIKFTFKVDRDSIKGQGRSWVWKPKHNEVTMTVGDAVVNYKRHEMDSTHISTDRAFINDKFWLLVPFQLVWDETAIISESVKKESPIKKELLDMITITYPNEGGYTPGDAYDIFYDENYLIKEWIFRKGNSETPSLTTTFENYQDFNGIKIAKDHKQEGGMWNINFADLTITLE
ncbi:hypothetical protein [Winogradskyella alexanderae]|uniref:Outer membrane lipoprotein-sorting protein n=1 Tax=Winogradskyella alexanderae TaxID=2877123 RepID=A0ABS7XTA4_9FLAO|nr:hypothetical protein [Winogradskyella alexanderae]MCA0133020.1 hypothetical protein [Winogradskyella alexanderae]